MKIANEDQAPVTVLLADGTTLSISHGKSKTLIVRPGSNKLHLLDCTCQLCQEVVTAKALNVTE
jgi:hypothetical protein